MDNEKTILLQKWVRIATLDLDSAEHMAQKIYRKPIEIICYLCQQSAEKFLKSFLVLHDIDPPKIHDLKQLRKLCEKIESTFSEIEDFCAELTVYGVQARYPMETDINLSDVDEAIDKARKIKAFIQNLASELIFLEEEETDNTNQN